MDLKFNLVSTKYFLKQFSKLSLNEKKLVNSKLDILKKEPNRFKKLSGFKNTYEIKITVNNSFSRLIYVLYLPEKNNITLFGIFNRGKDFNDFYRYYKNSFKK